MSSKNPVRFRRGATVLDRIDHAGEIGAGEDPIALMVPIVCRDVLAQAHGAIAGPVRRVEACLLM